MNRADLAGMLNDQTTACEPAKAALLGEGDFVVWDGIVPAQQLAGVYAARLRRARNRGTETLALPETVDILTRLAAVPVGSAASSHQTGPGPSCCSLPRTRAQSSHARESDKPTGDSCPAQVTTILLRHTRPSAGGVSDVTAKSNKRSNTSMDATDFPDDLVQTQATWNVTYNALAGPRHRDTTALRRRLLRLSVRLWWHPHWTTDAAAGSVPAARTELRQIARDRGARRVA